MNPEEGGEGQGFGWQALSARNRVHLRFDHIIQKNSRRLWWSPRRKSRSIFEFRAKLGLHRDLFLAGNVATLETVLRLFRMLFGPRGLLAPGRLF